MPQVYDGHGGSGCATYVSSRLHLLLDEKEVLWREDPGAAIRRAFMRSEAELRAGFERSRDKSGTCALIALLRGHRLFVANLGDCRAVLLRSETHPQPVVRLATTSPSLNPSIRMRNPAACVRTPHPTPLQQSPQCPPTRFAEAIHLEGNLSSTLRASKPLPIWHCPAGATDHGSEGDGALRVQAHHQGRRPLGG